MGVDIDKLEKKPIVYIASVLIGLVGSMAAYIIHLKDETIASQEEEKIVCQDEVIKLQRTIDDSKDEYMDLFKECNE